MNPFFAMLLVFFSGMIFFKTKDWLKLRNYSILIRGSIKDIQEIDNKLYFIISWKEPKEYRVTEETHNYLHFIKNIKKNTSIEKYSMKYLEKSFYLKGKLSDNKITEVTALDSPGRSIILYTTLLVITLLFMFLH